MRQSFLVLLLVAAALVVLTAPARADALDDEYAAMRVVPGTDHDFVRCRLDPGTWSEVPTGSPCASPCAAPCRPVCEPICPPKCWDWRVGLWVWLPGFDGTTVIGGQEGDVDFAWTDWFDVLDKVEFVLQASVTAHYAKWTFELGGLRMVVGDSVPLEAIGPTGAPLALDAELTTVILKGLVGYDVATTRLSSCSCWPKITWTPYVGARYYSVGVEANLAGPNNQVRVLDETQDWIDPMVGGRARLDLDKRWSVIFEADVGGFGVGSDMAWHVLGGVEWRATRWLAIQAGWNGIDVDYETGSGADRFVFDMTLSGPYLGFVFLF